MEVWAQLFTSLFLFFAYYIFRIIDIVVVKFHSIKNLFDREYRSYFHISTNTKKAQFQLTYLFKLVSSPDIFFPLFLFYFLLLFFLLIIYTIIVRN